MNSQDKTGPAKAKQSTNEEVKALKLLLKKSEARADRAEARLAKLSKPTASKVPPAAPKTKEKHKVVNWREYNQALVDRGRIDVYLTPELLQEWGLVGKKK